MTASQHVSLTPREREIGELLTSGMTAHVIATILSISITTVRAHIRGLHTKSETRGIVELLHWTNRHLDCCLSTHDA